MLRALATLSASIAFTASAIQLDSSAKAAECPTIHDDFEACRKRVEMGYDDKDNFVRCTSEVMSHEFRACDTASDVNAC